MFGVSEAPKMLFLYGLEPWKLPNLSFLYFLEPVKLPNVYLYKVWSLGSSQNLYFCNVWSLGSSQTFIFKGSANIFFGQCVNSVPNWPNSTIHLRVKIMYMIHTLSDDTTSAQLTCPTSLCITF